MESASWPKNIVENLLQKSGMRHFIHIQHFNFTFNLHIYVIWLKFYCTKKKKKFKTIK